MSSWHSGNPCQSPEPTCLLSLTPESSTPAARELQSPALLVEVHLATCPAVHSLSFCCPRLLEKEPGPPPPRGITPSPPHSAISLLHLLCTHTSAHTHIPFCLEPHTCMHAHRCICALLPLLTDGTHCLPIPPGSRISLCAPDAGRQALSLCGCPWGCGGRHLQQQGLLHAFPEGLEFKLSLKRCWGWGELGNLLGPQAGECNTLLQKYSVILALSLENSDVTSSQSASGRSFLLLLLQLAVQKRERGRGGGREGEIQGDTQTTYRQTQRAMKQKQAREGGSHGKKQANSFPLHR